MCSIKATLNLPDGSQQTIARSAENSGKGDASVSDLVKLVTLQKQMVEVQSELNAALTVLVDKEKAAAATDGKQQTKKATDQEDDEDEEEDEDDANMKANGSGEPPEKIRKT